MSDTTLQQLFNAAYAMSTANDPGHTATTPELVVVARRILRALYRRAAGIDPLFFSTPVNVDGDGSKWARPAAAAVIRVEANGAAGTGADRVITKIGKEVHRVPLDDRLEAALPPRIYRVGRSYYSVGEASDPSASANGDRLRFYVAQALDEAALVDETSTLPTDWPKEFDDLVIIRLAIYVSLKDKARGDMTALKGEESDAVAEFDAAIAGDEVGTKGRFAGGPGHGESEADS